MPQWRRARKYLMVPIRLDDGKKTKTNVPLTNEFRMDMARFEIPVSGWTCFKTIQDASVMIDRWR